MKAIEPFDMRRARANALLGALLREIEPYIRDDGDCRQRAYESLLKLFHTEGWEVVSDFDRKTHGLPPRGERGWTADELRALEWRRLEALTKPLGSYHLPMAGAVAVDLSERGA